MKFKYNPTLDRLLLVANYAQAAKTKKLGKILNEIASDEHAEKDVEALNALQVLSSENALENAELRTETDEEERERMKKIDVVVGISPSRQRGSKNVLKAGYNWHTESPMNWWNHERFEPIMHVEIKTKDLPRGWEDIFFGSSKSKKLFKVDFSNVEQIAKYAAKGQILIFNLGYTVKNSLKKAGPFVKKSLDMLRKEMKSTNASIGSRRHQSNVKARLQQLQ